MTCYICFQLQYCHIQLGLIQVKSSYAEEGFESIFYNVGKSYYLQTTEHKKNGTDSITPVRSHLIPEARP